MSTLQDKTCSKAWKATWSQWSKRFLCLVMLLSAQPGAGQVSELVGSFRRLVTPEVTLSIDHPPKLWVDIERVIFAEAKGKCSDELQALLEQEFVQRGVEVVDRRNLDVVLQEHGLIRTRLIEEETAIELGKILGGATLVTLDVQRCQTETPTWSKRSGKTTTRYAKAQTFVKGSAQVIDLETTRIFSSQVFEADFQNTNRSSSGPVQRPSQQLVHDQAIRLAAAEVLKLLFRWQEGVTVPFFDSKKCGLKKVYQQIVVGDFGAAEARAEKAVDECSAGKDSLRARTYYGLGVTQFLQNDYESALGNFEAAYALDPEERTRRTVLETQRALEIERKLQGYLSSSNQKGHQQALADFAVAEAVEESKRAGSTESISERLKVLKGLLDDGLITEDEYAEKKAEILKDL